ncbi:MAG TPA: hypothetical protein VK779_01725 [Rhizomicrobium sp.]|jgi:hypothetical protein|nr:hypothetical protein [Rhizomicrobium sp.]
MSATKSEKSAGGHMIIGPGNYEVIYSDIDGRQKKIVLFMGDDHIDILQSSGFRVISGYEKKAGKNTPKIICLGQNQMATLELAN